MTTRTRPARPTTLRSPRGAFTLIELLVVVAIIALLISVLLPSLASAKQSARTTLCATNFRQIAAGWAIYAQEHRDNAIAARPATLPGDNLYFVGNGWKYRPRWLASLGAAAQIYAFDAPASDNVHQPVDNRLLICPEVRDWSSERNASYGYNYQFLGNARLKPGTQEFVRSPVRTDHLRSAETVLAADSLGTAAAFSTAERQPNRPDGSAELTAIGNHAYMLDPPRLETDSDRCDDGRRSAPDDRHRNRANFAYADGHVAADTSERAGYLRDGSGRYLDRAERDDEGEITNRLFSGSSSDEDPPPTQ